MFDVNLYIVVQNHFFLLSHHYSWESVIDLKLFNQNFFFFNLSCFKYLSTCNVQLQISVFFKYSFYVNV